MTGLLLCLLAAAPGCADRSADEPATSVDGHWLTILHTNDIHGAYALREATWRDDRPLVGGFLALSGTVEDIRTEVSDEHVLLLDAGDLMTGDPLTIVDYEGVPGGGAMAFLNAMRYDAMAIGNHEFDNGRREIEALLGMAEFPVLAANIWIEESGEPFAPAHVIIERGGVRVAVIGLILDGLARVVAAEPIAGLRIESTAAAARREVAALDPRSDLIIVILHAGLNDARELAQAVDGIDVIVAGHDHRRTRQPIIANGALIVETGSTLANVGRLDVQVAGDSVVAHRFDLKLLEAAAAERATPAVRAVYDASDAAIQARYGVEIAQLVRPFERDGREESNVGNWVTDAMREAAAADFAVANSSGLRADLAAGPVTRLDIHRLMPFRNLLSTFRCSGRDVERFARHNAQAALSDNRGVVQLSGLSYAFDAEGEIHDLLIGGKPVDPERTYTGATSDFVLFSQAERYLGFEPAVRERTTVVLTDLLSEEAARQRRIDARVEGRMRQLAAAAEKEDPISVSE